MNEDDIEQLLTASFDDARVRVQGDGGKYLVQIVSDAFSGLGPVKRQQAVYRVLNPHISSGAIHAVSMDLMTEAEYEEKH